MRGGGERTGEERKGKGDVIECEEAKRREKGREKCQIACDKGREEKGFQKWKKRRGEERRG